MNLQRSELVEKSEQINELLAALSAAQSTVKAAKKTGTNPHLRNEYAKLEDVWQVARPVLAKHGLSVTHLTVVEDNEAGVIQILGHSSGQFIQSKTMLPLSQGRGINPAQACGICFSYAKRYALSAALGVCTGEDTDGAVQTKADGDGATRPVPSAKEKLITKDFLSHVAWLIEEGKTTEERIAEVLAQGKYEDLEAIPHYDRRPFLGIVNPTKDNGGAPSQPPAML